MKKEQSLFIINSPFQAICALEALDVFSIEEPTFLILNDDNSRRQVTLLLKDNGKIVYFNHKDQGVKKLIKMSMALKIKANQVFVGDYFSYSQYIIAILCASFKAKIYYLDDGNSTLDIFPPVSTKRYNTKNEYLGFLFFDVCFLLKRLKKKFFSIFDIPGKEELMIKNNFNRFKSSISDVHQEGVYIIGTAPAQLRLECDYSSLLVKSIEFLRNRYPNEPLYYCPHRRDHNNYEDLFLSKKINVFKTEISVEVDFYNKKILPFAVAGYGSTALLTLKMINPSAYVCSFSFNSTSDEINKSYALIEKYYSQYGIEVI